MKKDAFYFSHDGNARNDEKLLAVRMKYKWEGYGLFWAIVEKLRETTNYVLSKDYNLIAFDLRCNASLIKSIIEDFGLFDFTDCGKFFYSERLLSDMKIKEEKSNKARESVGLRWSKTLISKGKNTNVLQSKNESNTKKEKKINKGNEIKESKEDSVLFFVSENFKPVFEKWLKYKSDRKEKYKSEDSEKACYEKLLKLSEGSPETAMEIVNQSMANNWAGLFELKEKSFAKKENKTFAQHAENVMTAREKAFKLIEEKYANESNNG